MPRCHFLVIVIVIAVMLIYEHFVKSVCIRSYSGPHFPAFGLNTKRYSVFLRIQSECGKMRAKIIPDTDTFYAVKEFFKNMKMSKILLRIGSV